jgi:hypothetical protein
MVDGLMDYMSLAFLPSDYSVPPALDVGEDAKAVSLFLSPVSSVQGTYLDFGGETGNKALFAGDNSKSNEDLPQNSRMEANLLISLWITIPTPEAAPHLSQCMQCHRSIPQLWRIGSVPLTPLMLP